MLHASRAGAPRPVDASVVIGADGPRGLVVAETLGDGLFSANPAFLADAAPPWRILLMWGTVLDPGEHIGSARVQAAIGPAAAVAYHAAYERGGDAVDALPGGRAWRETVEQAPAGQRHLAVHAGHQLELNAADRAVAPLAEPVVSGATLVGDPARVRDQLAEWHAAGITEVAYQPGGPDIPAELERFMAAAHS
jgi:5,10-methylenetetrahydromethanopterin reductase